ncbi:MAG: hypothetical protein IKU84_06805 [Clostridia bacterium]|nr:hypothetical protein [Clostridia bacterium]
MRTLSELLAEKNITSLRTYMIAENEMIKTSNVIGYVYEDGAWIVYEIDERRQKTVLKRYQTEEEAINESFKLIKAYHYMKR